MNLKKILLLVVIAGVLIIFFTTGLQDYLSLEFIKSSQARYQMLYHQHPFMVIAVFASIYIMSTVLNLPGGILLGLLAGALFGTLTGTIVVSFSSSIGATLACALSRYLLRDWVQKKFGDNLKKINQGIQEEGAFYLLSLRLIPIFPFFLINMLMGLTPIRMGTFYWVSQIGMLPATAVFVNAGSQLAKLDSAAGILSPVFLFSLALLGIVPLAARKSFQYYRQRSNPESQNKNKIKGQRPVISESSAARSLPVSQPFSDTLKQIQTGCTDCGACKKQCAFLQIYGSPKEIVDNGNFSQPGSLQFAFDCSLCGLCTAICPENLDPCALFLDIRRHAASADSLDLSAYKTILGYEKTGASQLFSYYALPKNCRTIFFPGCTLPGTRPDTTLKLFEYLKRQFPDIGIVLDCCTKPSHDLGRQPYFEAMFGEMKTFLENSGIKQVLVACPNCYKIFQQYAPEFETRTVYEMIQINRVNQGDNPAYEMPLFSELAVHDPCPMRNETEVQDCIRGLLEQSGINPVEMKHKKKRTICCGEGGSVGFIKPELSKKWGAIRQEEAGSNTIVTYCAGCAGFLNRVAPTLHIADILFNDGKIRQGKSTAASAPMTYLKPAAAETKIQIYHHP